jgi:hypothetical protein
MNSVGPDGAAGARLSVRPTNCREESCLGSNRYEYHDARSMSCVFSIFSLASTVGILVSHAPGDVTVWPDWIDTESSVHFADVSQVQFVSMGTDSTRSE